MAIEEHQHGFFARHRLEMARDLPGADVSREIDDEQIWMLGATHCHFELLDRSDALYRTAATCQQRPQARREIQGFVQDESFHELCVPFRRSAPSLAREG